MNRLLKATVAPRVARQAQNKSGAGVTFALDVAGRKVASATLTTISRPATLRFFNADGTVRHAITQPAGQSQTYDLATQNIPAAEGTVARSDGTTKHLFGPTWSVEF
jgi:hypothetical protein